jgi:hypothetical protein
LWLIFTVFMLVSFWEFSWAADDPVVLEHELWQFCEPIRLSWSFLMRLNISWAGARAREVSWAGDDPAVLRSMSFESLVNWWWSGCLEESMSFESFVNWSSECLEQEFWEFRGLMMIRLS